MCGDSRFNENLGAATKRSRHGQEESPTHLSPAAFNAGRYGVACGTICDAVKKELGIPVLTGMYIENPGADMFRTEVLIVSTANSAAGMRKAVPVMAKLALKLVKGERIGASVEEGYIPDGVRRNFFDKKRGSTRALEMLLKKIAGKPFETEYPMPTFDRVPPMPAIVDMTKANIAIVTSGGIVPKGNPRSYRELFRIEIWKL